MPTLLSWITELPALLADGTLPSGAGANRPDRILVAFTPATLFPNVSTCYYCLRLPLYESYAQLVDQLRRFYTLRNFNDR